MGSCEEYVVENLRAVFDKAAWRGTCLVNALVPWTDHVPKTTAEYIFTHLELYKMYFQRATNELSGKNWSIAATTIERMRHEVQVLTHVFGDLIRGRPVQETHPGEYWTPRVGKAPMIVGLVTQKHVSM